MPLHKSIINFTGDVIAAPFNWAKKTLTPRKEDDGEEPNTRNYQSPVKSLPIVYGDAVIGTNRVFVGNTDGITFLHQVLTLCEGEVDSIGDVFFDDKLSSTFDPLYFNITKYVGTPTQLADPVNVAAFGDYTAAFQNKGIAYLVVKLEFETSVWDGLPTVKAKVFGKKCYDPRTTLTALSYNPVICTLDYMTSFMDIPLADFDIPSIIAVANLADQGVTRRRFSIACRIDTSRPQEEILEELLFSWRGSLQKGNDSKITFSMDAEAAVSFTFDEPEYEIVSTPTKDKYSTAEIEYTDADGQREIAIYHDPVALAIDGGRANILTDRIRTEASHVRMQDYAYNMVKESRSNYSLNIRWDLSAWQVTVNDVIDVNIGELNFVNKEFKVREVTMDSDLNVSLLMTEYQPDAYTLDVIHPAKSATLTNDKPSALIVQPPTALAYIVDTDFTTNGTKVGYAIITWVKPTDTSVTNFAVEYRVVGSSDWISGGYITSDIANTVVTRVKIESALDYEFRVASVNARQRRSSYVQITTPSPIALAADDGSVVGTIQNLALKIGSTRGSDFHFVWDVTNHTGQPIAATEGAQPTYYRVRILGNGVTLLRDEFVTMNEYVYTLDKNSSDAGTSLPYRNVTIEVLVRDVYGRLGATVASLAVLNAVPDPTENVFTLLAGSKRLTVVLSSEPSDNDFIHSEVHISTTSSFTPSASTFVGKILKGERTHLIDFLNNGSQLVNGTAHYVRLIPTDPFGFNIANFGTQVAGTPTATNTTQSENQFQDIDLTIVNSSSWDTTGFHVRRDPYSNGGIPGFRCGDDGEKYIEFSEPVIGQAALKLGRDTLFRGADSYGNNAIYDHWLNTPSNLNQLSTVSTGSIGLHPTGYTDVQVGATVGSTFEVSRSMSLGLDVLSWSKSQRLRFALRPTSFATTATTYFVIGQTTPAGVGSYAGWRFRNLAGPTGPITISPVYNDGTGEVVATPGGISYLLNTVYIFEIILDVVAGTISLFRNGALHHTFAVNSNTFGGTQTRLWTIAMNKPGAEPYSLNIGQIKFLQEE